jgi:hypothetical protein
VGRSATPLKSDTLGLENSLMQGLRDVILHGPELEPSKPYSPIFFFFFSFSFQMPIRLATQHAARKSQQLQKESPA